MNQPAVPGRSVCPGVVASRLPCSSSDSSFLFLTAIEAAFAREAQCGQWEVSLSHIERIEAITSHFTAVCVCGAGPCILAPPCWRCWRCGHHPSSSRRAVLRVQQQLLCGALVGSLGNQVEASPCCSRLFAPGSFTGLTGGGKRGRMRPACSSSSSSVVQYSPPLLSSSSLFPS